MTASAAQNLMGRVLAGLDPDFFATLSDTRAATLRTFAAGSVADAHPGDLEALLSLLRRQPGELLWWKPPLLQGLARLTKPDAATAREIAALASQIDRLLADPSAPTDIRLALVPLLGSRPWPAVAPVLGPLLRNPQPQPILKACVAVLQKFPAPTTAPLLHELLPGAGPALKRDLATLLLAHPATALDLLQRMEKGELPMGWVDVEKRWGLQRGNTELADLARRLFGQTQGNRGAVVSQYLASTGKPGDSAKGRAIFSSLCTGCHRLGDLGSDVGPSLADLRSKPPEALLSDILDPNRMFEARWSGYQITTHDGRALAGLIRSETPDSVVLVLPGGSTETLARTAIREMRSLDRTLMPEGFESAIPPEQMPDLLSFLLGR